MLLACNGLDLYLTHIGNYVILDASNKSNRQFETILSLNKTKDFGILICVSVSVLCISRAAKDLEEFFI